MNPDDPLNTFDEVAAFRRESYLAHRRVGFDRAAALYLTASDGQSLVPPGDDPLDDEEDLDQ